MLLFALSCSRNTVLTKKYQCEKILGRCVSVGRTEYVCDISQHASNDDFFLTLPQHFDERSSHISALFHQRQKERKTNLSDEKQSSLQ